VLIQRQTVAWVERRCCEARDSPHSTSVARQLALLLFSRRLDGFAPSTSSAAALRSRYTFVDSGMAFVIR
jgi:hypothetical protein